MQQVVFNYRIPSSNTYRSHAVTFDMHKQTPASFVSLILHIQSLLVVLDFVVSSLIIIYSELVHLGFYLSLSLFNCEQDDDNVLSGFG